MVRFYYHVIRLCITAVAFALCSMAVLADGDEQQPLIAIIIDDLGNDWQLGEAAINLPGSVTLAFLPHTPHTHDQAKRAYTKGKEIILHLPMESHSGESLGSGGLTLHMTEQHFISTLNEDLATIPHVAGLNNHMGSLLTRHPGAMGWLMKGIQEHGDLYFIDSRTTGQTVAEQTAREYAIPTARRTVFLDNEPNPAAIRKQFRLLLRRAHQNGSAIGICHPHGETMQVLAAELARLDVAGVRLVAVSKIIEQQRGNDDTPKTASDGNAEPGTNKFPDLWHAPE